MKKIISLLSIVLLIILSFVLINNEVIASTPDAYMIVANPGQDSSIEMNIGWHTSLENTKSYIVYTTKDDTSWNNKKQVYGSYKYVDAFKGIESKTASGANITQDVEFLDYSVTLTDLLPDTEYMYKVGQNVLSDVQYFKTAGSTEFSFAWISDFHAYAPIPGRLKSAMNMIGTLDNYNNGFDFIFSTGDELAWGGSYDHWKDLFNEKYHKNYMWAGLMGNHDYMDKTNSKNKNAFFESVHAYPRNGYQGEEGVCYYFTYSNVLFITMNNETQTSSAEVKKAQDWFEEVVTRNPAQYIVVAQHYQWFNGSSGSFNNSTGYGRWKELFDKYNVDLAISGNNHIYVRSKPIYQDKVSTDYRYGTTYIQTCSSDNERGSDMGTLSYNKDIIASRFTEGGRTVGGIIVNVNEQKIKVELLDRNGKLIDSTEIKARRDVYPMNNFDKEEFIEKITYLPSNRNDQTILSFDESGIGYVKDIKVKKDNEVVASTIFKRDLDTLLTINNLPKDSTTELEVLITYRDGSSDSKKISVNTEVLNGIITNFDIKIANEGYKVTFENTYEKLDEIKVYLNNELVSTNSGNIKEVTVPSNTKNINDIIRIEAIKNNAIITSKNINYYSPVDINCDGEENSKDLEMLTNKILEINNGLQDDIFEYSYDLNNDGVLDVKDATYLLMYLNKEIATPKVKQFKVTFMDANGNIIAIQNVNALEDASISNPELEGYTFIGWDTDFTNVTSDIIVKAVYSKN